MTKTNQAMTAAVEALGVQLIKTRKESEWNRRRWRTTSRHYNDLRKKVQEEQPIGLQVLDLAGVQAEVGRWSRKNFDDGDRILKFIGIVEEVGELGHALLKEAQGIRKNEDHAAAKRDAVGDMLIYLCDYCELEGLSIAQCLEETWSHVRTRDWRKHPIKGRPLTYAELDAQCSELTPPQLRELRVIMECGKATQDTRDILARWDLGLIDEAGHWCPPISAAEVKAVLDRPFTLGLDECLTLGIGQRPEPEHKPTAHTGSGHVVIKRPHGPIPPLPDDLDEPDEPDDVDDEIDASRRAEGKPAIRPPTAAEAIATHDAEVLAVYEAVKPYATKLVPDAAGKWSPIERRQAIAWAHAVGQGLRVDEPEHVAPYILSPASGGASAS